VIKRVAAIALVMAMAAGSSACSRRDTEEKKLLGLIDNTAKLSNRYVYQEAVAGQSVTVRGLVEDDFRFKARLTLNDKDILDEVVADDALAVRFLEPSVLPQFVSASPSAGGVSPLEVLSQRQWVVDSGGAPPVGIATDERFAGVDPIVDSLAVLSYAKQGITEGLGVVKFNPESIDYRPAEDPFPTPKAGSGIIRYDVVLPEFPRVDTVARTSNTDAQFATTSNFRKMSFYVKDKKVIQVRERIAAEGKVLEKFTTYLKAFARQANNTEATKRLTQIIDNFQGDQRAQLLLQAYNLGLSSSGRPPIRFRSMTYELRDLGANVQVALPDGATAAKLDKFGVNAVQQKQAASAAGNAARSGAAGSSSAGSATTSTSAP
jgi:hypothetical protein